MRHEPGSSAIPKQAKNMHRAEYGYDAPKALAIFLSLTVLSGFGAAVAWWRLPSEAATPLSFYFLWFFGNAASFVYTTRRGKFIEWERILDGLRLTGKEAVLDMGCGRGALLTAVAHRLTTGRVTGIDVWKTADQSGNAPDVARQNASLEGVSDRVLIETADMRSLPYPDGVFDLVVSSIAIHNIRPKTDRAQAIREAFRVVKPGGRIVIADIRATAAYAEALRALGALNIERRRLGWRFWWGNPIAATTLLTASKPFL